MPYDLRFTDWIPWLRANGSIEWRSPAHITDGFQDDPEMGRNPIVRLGCPRADLAGAVTEFLIGLYTVALAPKDEAAWRKSWNAPPSPAEIEAALRALPDAFLLDGEGARAFQDFGPLSDDGRGAIGELLIEAPGDNTTKFNKDLFVKRRAVGALSRPAALMALITMQTYAPAGGVGYRTSMRGGGPMTTLAEPRNDIAREPFWYLIWANVETQDQLYNRDQDASREWAASDRYPWLAPAKTSNPRQNGRATTPVDADPLQAYFATPRRIRLDLEAAPGVCSLTGRPDEVMVPSFCAQNYGVNYEHWRHPLSPHYRDGDVWRPLHPQPGGIGWRDWLGLLTARPNAGREPAACVAHFASRRAKEVGLQRFRITAFGFDMDNMKARSWAQAEFPAFPSETLERQSALAERCVGGCDSAARLLVGAVKQGLFDNPTEAPGDFSAVRNALWDATKEDFFELMRSLAESPEFDNGKAAERFAETIRSEALAIFDDFCPIDGFEHGKMQRPIAARYFLDSALRGYGKKTGQAFFAALGLPPPQPAQRKTTKEPA